MATPDERPIRRQFKTWWESKEAHRALPHQKELYYKCFKAGYLAQPETEVAPLQLAAAASHGN